MVKCQVITPEEYKTNHSNFKILYGFHTTNFGKCIIAVTDINNAILHLAFSDNTEKSALDILKKEWPLSEILEDSKNVTKKIVDSIFSEKNISNTDSINVLLKGTEFQTKVWQSILSIPRGASITYEKVAEMIGNPKAVRAVGNALSKNKIAYLVPCHRVRGKTSNKYTWGLERKENILAYENTH